MPSDALLAREIVSPLGTLRLRPEQATDATFLFALFRDARPELALLPLDEAIKERLMHQQFQAQAANYAARYPQALGAIVDLDGRPMGRLVVDETGEELHLVDIAISSNLRGRGLGSAILVAVTDLARNAGLPVRLYVSTANPGALALYLRHGFRETGRDVAHVEMQWRA